MNYTIYFRLNEGISGFKVALHDTHLVIIHTRSFIPYQIWLRKSWLQKTLDGDRLIFFYVFRYLIKFYKNK